MYTDCSIVKLDKKSVYSTDICHFDDITAEHEFDLRPTISQCYLMDKTLLLVSTFWLKHFIECLNKLSC